MVGEHCGNQKYDKYSDYLKESLEVATKQLDYLDFFIDMAEQVKDRVLSGGTVSFVEMVGLLRIHNT